MVRCAHDVVVCMAEATLWFVDNYCGYHDCGQTVTLYDNHALYASIFIVPLPNYCCKLWT